MTELTKEQESLFHKVRSLLKKAESTPFEEEAAAFMEKAQQLISKHAIDDELLWATEPEKREQIATADITILDRSPGAMSKRTLMHRIALNNSCRCWYVSGTDTTKIAGYPNDLIFCEMLYTSIAVQMNFQLAHSLARNHAGGNSKIYRKEFINGYSERVTERLAEQAANVREWLNQQDTTGSTELVLRDRKHKVDEWVDDRVQLSRSSYRDTGKRDYGARAQGRVAGETADISGGRGGSIKSGRKELNR